jgi:putative endonuclease
VNPLVRSLLGRLLGDAGERAAARHLRLEGLRIITRGYRTALGEIDLIARDGDTLVFVEVKTRRRGEPAEAVTDEKQRRLIRAALQFVRRFGLHETSSRFDVVAVVWPEDRRSPSIEHIRNAFDASGRGSRDG